jgi:hypothetical protein
MRDSHGTYDGRVPEPPYECPQCARFREKVTGLEHFIRIEGLYDHPGDAAIIAPKLIAYLTE